MLKKLLGALWLVSSVSDYTVDLAVFGRSD